MKKTVFTSLLGLLFSLSVFAQEENKETKLFAGGNFGLSFGSYTLINLNHQVGYRFNRFLGAGLGVNLLYASEKEKDALGNDYRKVVEGITGLNAFVRFYPIQRILIQVQPEENYIFGKQIFYQPVKESYPIDAIIVPSILVGGGLATPTRNGAMLFTLMYDVLQNPNSPYGKKPIVNFGYNFNF